MAADAGAVFIEEGYNGNDFGQALADQFGDERFFADTPVGLAKFLVAPDEGADHRGIRQIKGVGIKAGLHRAGHGHAQFFAQIKISGGAQVFRPFIPNDDLRARHAGGEQAPGDGADDRRAGAAEFAGRGKNFQAHDVVGFHQRQPGGGHGGGAGKMFQAKVKGVGHPGVVRQEGIEQAMPLHDDDPGGGGAGRG